MDRFPAMSSMATDVLSHRNMSDLTHFGEHGEENYSSPSIMSTSSNKRGIETSIVMSVEQITDADKEMNCLEILAGVVSRCSSSEIEQGPLHCSMGEERLEVLCRPISERGDQVNPQEHRVSCHRCGNIRKRKIVCERPQVCFLNFNRWHFATKLSTELPSYVYCHIYSSLIFLYLLFAISAHIYSAEDALIK